MLATLTWWRSLVQIQPRLFQESGVNNQRQLFVIVIVLVLVLLILVAEDDYDYEHEYD